MEIESGLQGAFQAAEGVCQRERHLAAALLSAAIRVLQISHQGEYKSIYLSFRVQPECNGNVMCCPLALEMLPPAFVYVS